MRMRMYVCQYLRTSIYMLLCTSVSIYVEIFMRVFGCIGKCVLKNHVCVCVF